MNRGFIALLTMLFAAVWLSVGVVSRGQAHSELTHPTQSLSPQKAAQIQNVIDEQLNFYNGAFDQIRFAHLAGGADWSGELIAVLTLLGSQPTALDYQHPPELRADLMEATVERLRRLLRADVVSATMVRVGPDSPLDRPNLCLITLNPQTVIADDYQATRYMLDLQEAVAEQIHPSRYLQHMEHLRFVLDHEAFHCIDSFLHGGARPSREDLEAEYELFRRETVADAYAMARHIQHHQQVTRYARNLAHIRALWMFSDSPNRCTFETVREVLRLDPQRLQAMSTQDLADLAVEVRDETVRPYHGYLHQRAAALKAARILGLDPELYGSQWCECELMEVEPELVANLVNRYRYYFEQLFTAAPIELDAPSLFDSHEQR